MPFKHVLDGYRVLDFTQALAGPTVTRLMAEMGAEIIKIELAPSGDMVRAMPHQRNGRSGYYIQQNRGKKSVCLNGKTPQGREILHDLVKKCDVLVENFAPGVISRLGLAWEVVHELNPMLVMCSVSAFGQTGPLSYKPGYDMIGGAYASLLDMTGDPDGPPSFPGFGVGDASTGVAGLAATLAALLHREKIGEGQYVEASLLDTYFHCHEVAVQRASSTNGAFQPTRTGSHLAYVAPFGLHQAKDGWIFIAGIRDQWDNLTKAMGREDLLKDPRFANNDLRVENRAPLTEIIEQWTKQHTVAEAEQIFDQHRVPCAPVLSVWQAMNHPHMIERETIRTIHDPVYGDYQVPGSPLRFSKYPGHLDLRAGYLGEHNEEVLSGLLGYPAQKLRELEAAGVLQSKPDLERAAAE